MSAWCDFIGPSIFHLDIEPEPEVAFHASTKVRQLPGIVVSSTRTSPARFSRRAHAVATDVPSIDLFVSLNGGYAEQGRKHLQLAPGTAYFMDGIEPGSFASAPGRKSHCLHIRVPRNIVGSGEPHLYDGILKPLRIGAARMQYIVRVSRYMLLSDGLTDPQFATSAGNHLRDLIGFALTATIGKRTAETKQGLHAFRIGQAKAFVSDHLPNTALSVEMAALHLGTSPRTLQRLFSAEGTSFSDYVLRRRLEAACLALADPHRSRTAIVQIALDCGFGDLSYFHRCFRRQYGISPGTFRILKT